MSAPTAAHDDQGNAHSVQDPIYDGETMQQEGTHEKQAASKWDGGRADEDVEDVLTDMDLAYPWPELIIHTSSEAEEGATFVHHRSPMDDPEVENGPPTEADSLDLQEAEALQRAAMDPAKRTALDTEWHSVLAEAGKEWGAHTEPLIQDVLAHGMPSEWPIQLQNEPLPALMLKPVERVDNISSSQWEKRFVSLMH
jgi:hypothetical protein